jgi:hypothetical protein
VKAQLDGVFKRLGGWDIVVDLTREKRYDRPELVSGGRDVADSRSTSNKPISLDF